MATGNDTGDDTADNTDPHPITSPFDWGLGSSSAPVPPVLAEPAVPAVPVVQPESAEPVPAATVPAEPAQTELMPAAAPTSPYFSSDSDDDIDPASPLDPASLDPSSLDPASLDPASLDSASLDSASLDSPSPDSASPIDSLFGETHFKDYEGEPLFGPIPTELNPFATPPVASTPVASAAAAPAFESDVSGSDVFGSDSSRSDGADVAASPSAPRGPRAPFSKNQKLLFWVAGGVIAVLVLVVLFVIGTKIAAAPVAKTTTSATKSAAPKVSPSPTPTAVATGPAAAGPHLWSDLRGGECVDPYSNPFELRYTVVDCAAPHPAQMVFRGTFPGEATAAYPGLEALQSQINLLCSAPGVINLATAGAYSDIQFQASYAATAAEWDKGQHDYFCFVNRSGGEPITGTVAGTPAK